MAENVEVDEDRKANATRPQRFWTEALPIKPSPLTKLESLRREVSSYHFGFEFAFIYAIRHGTRRLSTTTTILVDTVLESS